MKPDYSDTAILLFSRSAVDESIAKPLLKHAKKLNRALSADLIRHARRLARCSGLPVVFISGKQQQGNTFGERFSNAFQQVFDRGYNKVIAIGNDCPALRASNLLEAAQKLQTQAVVIGPAADGGAYLVGLQKRVFQEGEFAAIRWQSASVLEDLTTRFGAASACLEMKSDLDSEVDLQRALQLPFFPERLRQRIVALLSSLQRRSFCEQPIARSIFSTQALWLRGPPHSASLPA